MNLRTLLRVDCFQDSSDKPLRQSSFYHFPVPTYRRFADLRLTYTQRTTLSYPMTQSEPGGATSGLLCLPLCRDRSRNGTLSRNVHPTFRKCNRFQVYLTFVPRIGLLVPDSCFIACVPASSHRDDGCVTFPCTTGCQTGASTGLFSHRERLLPNEQGQCFLFDVPWHQQVVRGFHV